MRTFIFSLCLALLCSCSQKQETPEKQPTPKMQAKVELPSIDVYTVGKVPDKLRDAMIDSLRHHYAKCRFKGNLPLPRSAYYEPRKRYLADSLVAYLGKKHTKSNIVVGLTTVDISLCHYQGYDNFGIMGLTNSIGGGVCVFSNYRKRTSDGLFQVMRHELGHAVGLHHCKTSKTCLMHAAEGTDLKGAQFCKRCNLFLTKKGWK